MGGAWSFRAWSEVFASTMTLSETQLNQPDVGDEVGLWAAYKKSGSIVAREKLFALHLPFARNIARRHYRERTWGELDFADLSQLACVGLLEALDRFDPERGSPFRGFAAPRIFGNIADGIARMSEVREQLSWKHRMQRERIASLVADESDQSGLADAMTALSDLALGLALGFMLEGTGLMTDPEDMLSSRATARSAYESLVWKDMIGLLMGELATLPEREQIILRHHYIEGVSFEALASLLKLSKGRVSQIHRAALAQLRKKITGKGHFRLER